MVLMNLVENRPVGTVGKVWRKQHGPIYALICKRDGGKLLNNTGNPAFSVMT